jgi:hypothetical protein
MKFSRRRERVRERERDEEEEEDPRATNQYQVANG